MGSKLFEAPQIDSATIDYYVARGRSERARAFSEMIRAIFSSPSRDSAEMPARKPAEVHTLPGREMVETGRQTVRARAA